MYPPEFITQRVLKKVKFRGLLEQQNAKHVSLHLRYHLFRRTVNATVNQGNAWKFQFHDLRQRL